MSEVLVEARDGVQVITINRPEARNAVNGAVARGVSAALAELDASDELRVGVLTGAGGTFCSGMDLRGFLSGDLPFVDEGGFSAASPRDRRASRSSRPSRGTPSPAASS